MNTSRSERSKKSGEVLDAVKIDEILTLRHTLSTFLRALLDNPSNHT